MKNMLKTYVWNVCKFIALSESNSGSCKKSFVKLNDFFCFYIRNLPYSKRTFKKTVFINRIVFNEINTLPGFTAISMYPMLWEARGISKPQLVDALIDHAFKRYER